MKDNDIIKALGHCIANGDCEICVYNEKHCLDMLRDALDLINCQRTEIERLKQTPKCIYAYDGETMEYCVEGPCSVEKTVGKIKNEAVMAFAEKLKSHLDIVGVHPSAEDEFIFKIDEVVKEMTEGV